MLLFVGFRINRHLATGGNYALVRFSALVAILIGAFSESHFGRMSPLGFLFLLAALDGPWLEQQVPEMDAALCSTDPLPVANEQASEVPAFSCQ
jgi:hypothetical protein